MFLLWSNSDEYYAVACFTRLEEHAKDSGRPLRPRSKHTNPNSEACEEASGLKRTIWSRRAKSNRRPRTEYLV